MKVCAEPGCPRVQPESRCAEHRRARENARGSRQARGYDASHDALRAQWAPLVATGNVKCWRCKEYLDPAKPWHLGHDDHDRSRHRGPECVACNTATNGRRISPGA